VLFLLILLEFPTAFIWMLMAWLGELGGVEVLLGTSRSHATPSPMTDSFYREYLRIFDTGFASVINFTSHSVILGTDNLCISSDYPGAVERLFKYLAERGYFSEWCCGNYGVSPSRSLCRASAVHKEQESIQIHYGRMLLQLLLDVYTNNRSFFRKGI